MPTGQVDEEGWFAPPPPFIRNGFRVIRYADQRPSSCNRYTAGESVSILDGQTKDAYDLWIEEFVAGVIRQDCLDKVRDVMPIRNHDLVNLIGMTCVAIVYDSDINPDYRPLYANLQGRRMGKFTFHIDALELPGEKLKLPIQVNGNQVLVNYTDSSSDTDFYDVCLTILAPMEPNFPFEIPIRDHEPDSIQIAKAVYSASKQKLQVVGKSDFAPTAVMTVSVDGPDKGKDCEVDPSVFEEMMMFSNGKYSFSLMTAENLVGRRVMISTDEGGAYSAVVKSK
jgi:hypothetical protein